MEFVKVDLEKAYDKVNVPFLEFCLHLGSLTLLSKSECLVSPLPL